MDTNPGRMDRPGDDPGGLAGAAAAAPWLAAANHLPGLITQWMQEGTRFLTTRMQADAEALRAMQACRTPADFAEIHQRWVSEASQAWTTAMLGWMEQARHLGTPANDPGGAAPGGDRPGRPPRAV